MKTLRISYLLALLFIYTISSQNLWGQEDILPGENNKTPAISYDYFPSRLHTFVWRNWMLIPSSHLAKVVGTDAKNLENIAFSMGLPVQPKLQKEWSTSRGYITVLRRNWHLLPYDQLLVLLNMTRKELSWRLIEDDFLTVKLGTKPYCEPLTYSAPTEVMKQRAKEIKAEVKQLGKNVFKGETPRFKFIEEFKNVDPSEESAEHLNMGESEFDLRLIFSYFTDYGDPLVDPDLSSYPEGLLKKLSDRGVNGIWLHTVLRTLVAPDDVFPGEDDYKMRIEGLNKLVQRAAKYGIGIYLYTNEPRAMTIDYFEADTERKKLAGVKQNEFQVFCPSKPEVLDWLTRSYEKIFKSVPGLGGVFTITASENFTSCVSHHKQHECPNCSKQPYSKVIADISTAISKGVKKGNPESKVIVWDWGWSDAEAENIINRLPKDVRFMSVSEWSLPIERGGVTSQVGEYSISSVGPGPRALKHWEYARKAGLKTMAKVQVNCTWELSIIPSIPVMDLVAQHAENLKMQSVDGVMLSWSLGGYPSKNLEIFQSVKPGNIDETLDFYARTYYGEKAKSLVRSAWTSFSNGFKEYPYHITTVYQGPQHMGPSNPLFVSPTGYGATMVGLPYDDLNAWKSIYPTDVWISQMEKVAEGFEEGCAYLTKAKDLTDKKHKSLLESDLLQAKVAQIHFASCAAQAGFVEARNNYLNLSVDALSEKKHCLGVMEQCLEQEKEHVKLILPLAKKDPKIGYESSNQYFYLPIDLVEKVININEVERWIKEQKKILSEK